MSSHRKKTFPPGTFIPTTQRLMAIAQLCFAFSLMFCYLAQPFMGEYFSLRSRMLLYEYVMGTADILKTQTEAEGKLERQEARFKKLSETEQDLLKKDYRELQSYAKRSMLRKIQDGILTLMQNIPPFEQAWIFFSIIIAILILLKVEEAKLAAWLLPLIVVAYSFDNQITGTSFASPDLHLFPTEDKLIERYLAEPLAESPFKQKEQLEKAWKNYLIDHWSNNETQINHIEEAEFQFTLARLRLLSGQHHSEWLNRFHEKSNPISLLLFLAWNLLFAWVVKRYSKNNPKRRNRLDLNFKTTP